MRLTYSNTIWSMYQEIKQQLDFYDSLKADNPNRENNWKYRALTKTITIDEGRELLKQAEYLISLKHKIAINGNITGQNLTKPVNFDITVEFMKNKLEHDIIRKPELLKRYKGVERTEVRYKIDTEITGLKLYIERLQDESYLSLLPEIIYTLNNKQAPLRKPRKK